jgi:hypothetical protein
VAGVAITRWSAPQTITLPVELPSALNISQHVVIVPDVVVVSMSMI